MSNYAGRNEPCPCGSGVKYKKCCLPRETEGRPIIPVSQEVLDAIHARHAAVRAKRQRFGDVNPVIHADFHGHKFVAVGSELHYSKDWRTFPDFLMHYSKVILGSDWGNAEIAKPFEERHEIMRWYDLMCRFQQEQDKGPDGLYGMIPNGAMRAYLLLAYDLYTLRHHGALQGSILRRLKHPDQFQGARHELFATATCIRAGYDIEFEDDTDSSRKHTEFIAAHRTTTQEIAVEAKSRHRSGILGRRGPRLADVQARIDRLLRDALGKPVSHPYVIFIDVNLPPTPEPVIEKAWFREIVESVDRVAKRQGERDCFNLIVFTNHPDHYMRDNIPPSSGSVVSVFGRNPRIPVARPEAIACIDSAARQYGTIPNTFEEAAD